VRPDTWVVGGLVHLPVLSFDAAPARPSRSLELPERSRRCHECGQPVGRSYAGQEALSEGHCPRCGTRYSFVPGLRDNALVSDRYKVVGCLARGGQGWVYRAKDTHLDDNDVVLKGLINAADQVALELAVGERRFLTDTHHPNIVRIFGFATDWDPRSERQTGYIVMEYLDGMSLHDIRSAARDPDRPNITLPAEHILAYGHEILSALDYLHGQELVYCDLKPDNLIRVKNGVKLIDLGGVRRFNDRTSPIVGVRPYLVGDEEIETHGLTVRSDLYALGVTLDELFRARTPSPAGASAPLGVESFQRLVKRARHDRWSRRFASAADMSAQLTGVLREILPSAGGVPRPDPSITFMPSAVLLDAGLGAVPPLQTWTAGPGGGLLDAGCPPAPMVAIGLPAPAPVPEKPDDPAVSFLETVSAPDARSLLAKLSTYEEPSIEIELCRCRAYLELAELDSAKRDLAAAAGMLGAGAARDWRVTWHRGLLALAGDDVAGARDLFDEVYADLPGELAPKLALGYCAERLGQHDRAVLFYETVWHRDRLQASAAFGLARVSLARGDRAAAVALLDAVPPISQHYDAARVAAVRVLAARLPGDLPGAASLNEAVRRLPELHLDGGDADGEHRARLTAALREVALDVVEAGGAKELAGGEVLGSPPSARDLCALLESSFRSLAGQARTVDDHSTLVDRANSVRPRTLLRLR
jgi:serine/threonine-protein kinase PknG